MKRTIYDLLRWVAQLFGAEILKGIFLAPILALFSALIVWLLSGIDSANEILKHDYSVELWYLVALSLISISIGGIIFAALFWKTISKFKSEAAIDFTLGVYNTRECKRRLDAVLAESKRHKKSFSICLFDVDGLKKFNDAYGYRIGDRLLREFVQITRDRIRKSDSLFRYRQGDEFLVLLPNTDVTGAKILAETLCEKLSGYPVQVDGSGETKTGSVSIGVTWYDSASQLPDNLSALLASAEGALIEAKKRKKAVFVVYKAGEVLNENHLQRLTEA